ncbi:MAG: hypothetical protein PVI26_13345 [Chitinispirillia bacterium]|jgi:predicted nucleic-acid-binding Zn-ribbon protein
MNKTKKSQSKISKFSCDKCGGSSFKNTSTTYPLNLFNKQINVNRVAVKKCLDCQKLFPTTKGKEKLDRALQAYIMMMNI